MENTMEKYMVDELEKIKRENAELKAQLSGYKSSGVEAKKKEKKFGFLSILRVFITTMILVFIGLYCGNRWFPQGALSMQVDSQFGEYADRLKDYLSYAGQKIREMLGK